MHTHTAYTVQHAMVQNLDRVFKCPQDVDVDRDDKLLESIEQRTAQPHILWQQLPTQQTQLWGDYRIV